MHLYKSSFVCLQLLFSFCKGTDSFNDGIASSLKPWVEKREPVRRLNRTTSSCLLEMWRWTDSTGLFNSSASRRGKLGQLDCKCNACTEQSFLHQPGTRLQHATSVDLRPRVMGAGSFLPSLHQFRLKFKAFHRSLLRCLLFLLLATQPAGCWDGVTP